jgi:prepilin-type N-terminal cleavage/methylation domain-containing protein
MASGTRSIRSQAGFTLLEMLVAVTLIALMAVGLWGVFRISIRSWARGTEFMDANQRQRSILNLVRKQMASTYGLVAPPDEQEGGTASIVFNGTESSLRFISLNSLQFQESPGLTLTSYEVGQEPTGGFALVERESRYLGRLPEDGSLSGSRTTPIFENLSSCLFEYFDPGDGENPARWVREWDGKKLGRFPLAVSVTMESHDPRGNTLSRHMVVPIKAEPNPMRPQFINPFGRRRPMGVVTR